MATKEETKEKSQESESIVKNFGTEKLTIERDIEFHKAHRTAKIRRYVKT